MRGTIEYRSFRLARSVFFGMPLASARRWGRRLGRLAYWVLPARRRLVLGNLESVFPDLPPRERRRLARKVFANSGSAFIEPLSLAGMKPAEAATHFDVVGREHLDRLLTEKRGFLLLTAHYGIWEVATIPVQDQLVPLYVIAKEPSNPRIGQELEEIRSLKCHETIPASGGTLKVFRILRRGGRIGILIDQRVLPTEGLLLPFLGEAAWTTPMLASISARTGAPVLPFLCEPVGEDRLRVTFYPPIEAHREGNRVESELTRRYLAFMEDAICARPELWFWLHDRWKRVKRHRWPQTIARLWKLSGLDPEAAGSYRAAPHLARVADRATSLESLQRGDSYAISGGSTSEQTQYLQSVGSHLLSKGFSFSVATLRPEGSWHSKTTPEDPLGLVPLDFFDLIAVQLPASAGADHATAVATLLHHRIRLRRSTLLLAPASWQPAPGFDEIVSVDGVRPAALHRFRWQDPND